MTQKFLTGLAFTSLLGLGMVVGTAQPGSAFVGDTRGREIVINGHQFYGNWAYVRDRPFISVHGLEKALGLPHRHDTRNWYLGADGAPTGSPLQSGVEAPGGKLPSVNYGGTTMVDLQSACKALHVHYHEDFTTRTYYVGRGM